MMEPSRPIDCNVSTPVDYTVRTVDGSAGKDLAERKDAIEYGAVVLSHEAHVVLRSSIRVKTLC